MRWAARIVTPGPHAGWHEQVEAAGRRQQVLSDLVITISTYFKGTPSARQAIQPWPDSCKWARAVLGGGVERPGQCRAVGGGVRGAGTGAAPGLARAPSPPPPRPAPPRGAPPPPPPPPPPPRH